MKMALDGDTLYIIEANGDEFNTILGWSGKMTRSKTDRKRLEGFADLELLNNLYALLRKNGLRLPPAVEKRRLELRRRQDAVDRERVNQKPEPLFKYPVKMPLYAHQTRGANMALLTFGWADPETKGMGAR